MIGKIRNIGSNGGGRRLYLYQNGESKYTWNYNYGDQGDIASHKFTPTMYMYTKGYYRRGAYTCWVNLSNYSKLCFVADTSSGDTRVGYGISVYPNTGAQKYSRQSVGTTIIDISNIQDYKYVYVGVESNNEGSASLNILEVYLEK